MANPAVTYTFSNGTTADATQVNQNFTDLINGLTDGTKSLTIDSLTVGGTATFNGAVTLGNATADDITFTGSLASSIPIKTTNSFNIGSATLGLGDIFFGNGTNSNTVAVSGGVTTTSYTLTLPVAVPTLANSVMVFSTSGVGTFGSTQPTVQTFTSGTAQTYTTPAGVKHIRVRLVGGGGGSSGSGTAGGTAAGDGGTTSFANTISLSCTGGGKGVFGTNSVAPGAATITGAAIGVGFSGAYGQGGGGGGGNASSGGCGGGTPFCGGSGGGWGIGAAVPGTANSGAGSGGPGGNNIAFSVSGSGGSSGGYIDAMIVSPQSTYTYSVGAGGTAGGAGTSGLAGAAGAAGIIIVEEFYI